MASMNETTELDLQREAELNSFATRCFRDVADMDYINARLCSRACMGMQFHWAALQAIEKYYKAILLYNRIEAKRTRHDLLEAQKRLLKLPFAIELSQQSTDFILDLHHCGQDRYLTVSYRADGDKLSSLDKAVWELRRYCRPPVYVPSGKGGGTTVISPTVPWADETGRRPTPSSSISTGRLEQIIRKKAHPARPGLIWQNLYFAKVHRKVVRRPRWSQTENSPLLLYPELLEAVDKYVYIPKEVKAAYREYFKK